MTEWLIVPLQAGCMNRVMDRCSMIHRYVTNIRAVDGQTLPYD